MRSMKINQGWDFGPGQVDLGKRLRGIYGDRKVNLPHDYMIEGDVYENAPSGAASGYYNAVVAHYAREIEIPADWENDQIFLRFDGAMMNATVEVNGDLACLQHYGYAPFETDITRLVYPGQKNRVVVTMNPSMQPNSRWFSGAGLFRGVELVHTPGLHIAFGGLSGYTKKIEYKADGTPECAYLRVSAEIKNEYAENRLAEVTFALIDDRNGETVKTSKTLTQVQPLNVGTDRKSVV